MRARPNEFETCFVDDCGSRYYAVGLCRKHYQRQRNHGSLSDPRPTPEQRFWRRVTRRGDSECWPWIGGKDSHGYGAFLSADGVQIAAHRQVYLWTVGAVPADKMLDHTCHNEDSSCPGGKTCPHRACVNPAHLEPVTNQENQRRAVARYCAAVGGADAAGVDPLLSA